MAGKNTGTKPLSFDQPTQRGLLSRMGWKSGAAAALAVLLAVGGIVYSARQADLRARLMRADPDAIPGDAELVRFALSSARPAYDANCASCHGETMRGDRIKGTPDLTDQDWLYGDGRVAQIERSILYGIRAGNGKTLDYADMPGFGRPVPYKRYKIEPLEPGDIRDLTEYLLVRGGASGDRAAAERGAKIFGGHGQCFDCHAGDGRGDTAIGAPNLLDGIWQYGNGTREDIFDIIARGASGFCPAWFRQLNAVTIRALAVLIYAASHPPPPREASPSNAARTLRMTADE